MSLHSGRVEHSLPWLLSASLSNAVPEYSNIPLLTYTLIFKHGHGYLVQLVKMEHAMMSVCSSGRLSVIYFIELENLRKKTKM